MPLTASLVRLAAALDVSVDQLLVGIEWEVDGPRIRDPGGEAGGDPEEEDDDA
jgi:hypothetical protein